MPVVISVGCDHEHNFSKPVREAIVLVQGLGVVGDAHNGLTARHRTIVRKDPLRPNLRQVHLIHSELFDEMRAQGFELKPGDLGENVLTRGVDLLGLPLGARLRLGATALIEITGLRNPCRQIDAFQLGLKTALLFRTPGGDLVRKAGVMAVVVEGGVVASGDAIEISAPDAPHQALPVL